MYLFCNIIGLLTFPGKSMRAFKRDQVNSIRYTLGMQKRLDGYEIAQKAHHHYFIGNTKKSCHIPDQYADVCASFRPPALSIIIIINNNTELVLCKLKFFIVDVFHQGEFFCGCPRKS